MSSLRTTASRHHQFPQSTNGRRCACYLAAAVAVVGLLLSMTACSLGGSDKDTSAQAVLDYGTGDIELPLSAYDPSAHWQDAAVLERARRIDIGACMNALGLDYTAATVVVTADSQVGSRQYGMWDETHARRSGYEVSVDPVQAALARDEAAGGPQWAAASRRCSDQLSSTVRDFLPSDEETPPELVSRLQMVAYDAAAKDPAWQSARENWWSCLRKKGLEPQTGAERWVTKQGEASLANAHPDGHFINAEEIRVASIEAHCNVQTRLAQTLGDLEAAYQAPLVAKNQAALTTIKRTNSERVASARAYVASHK
jgi:hypothetical protein